MITYYLFNGYWPLYSASPDPNKFYAHIWTSPQPNRLSGEHAIKIDNISILINKSKSFEECSAFNGNHPEFIRALKDCLEGLIDG